MDEPHNGQHMDAGQLRFDEELRDERPAAEDSGTARCRAYDRAAGTEGVEVADVGLVLERVQAGEAPAVAQVGDRQGAVGIRFDAQHVVLD